MIKRDTVRRYIIETEEDQMGGNRTNLIPQEIVRAKASISTQFGNVTDYDLPHQLVLNLVTDIVLDESLNVRYCYSDKMFKIIRQIKQGNEYYSTLIQTKEEV